jgi:hypothetical protein
MTFSNSTMSKLAIALTPQICDEIFKSEDYVIFMENRILTVIKQMFNEKISEQLVGELSLMIFDNINLEPFKK